MYQFMEINKINMISKISYVKLTPLFPWLTMYYSFLGDVLRVKWKGLKDGYTKYKKQMANPGSSVYAKMYYNWCWAKHLNFLEICSKQMLSKKMKRKVYLPTLDDNHSSDSLLSDLPMPPGTPPISTNGTPSSPGIQIFYFDSPQLLTSEYVSESMPSTLTDTTLVKPIRTYENSFIRNSKLKRNCKCTSDEDMDKAQSVQYQRGKTSDAIDLLFNSYAETLKQFSLKTQVALKVKLAKLFADAEIENANESIEFTPSIVKVEHEHSTLSDYQAIPQNAVDFEVVQEAELSSLLKKSPASVDSSNDSQIIEEFFVD